ncbi:MAG TPA: hypothetical protein VE088_10655 [Gaiellaceae bacterium]|nr:hypothetical protein [Gaiellaceae bacterium]
MRRTLLIGAVLAAVGAGWLVQPAAGAAGTTKTAMSSWVQQPSHRWPHFRVVVVEDFTVADLRHLAGRAAVGLLVPGVGALTDRHVALESLVRGQDVNPYLKRRPQQPALLQIKYRTELPEHPSGNTIFVGLPPGGPLRSNETRYPIAIVGAGYRGLITSPTTRIRGLVSIVDVVPTALGYLRGRLGFAYTKNPVPQLRLLDGQISANDRLKLATLIILACTLVVLALVRPRAALPAVLAALAVNLVAGATHVANEPLLVAMMFLGTIVGGLAIARVCTGDRRLLAAILSVLAVYTVLLALHPDWVAITPLGPTQNARFWGIGNQLETILVAPVVAGAAIASRRYGLIGFGAFALLALVLVTDNRLGSDGGGAVVFGVALAFVGARVLRLGWRGFLTLLLLDGAVVTAIIQLNLRVPGPDHLRSAFSNGLPGLGRVIVNRIPLAYVPALRQWPLVLPLGLFLATVFAAVMRATEKRSRDLVLAASLALVVSLLVNDSGTYELAGGVGVLAALARASATFTNSQEANMTRPQSLR